MDPLLSMRHATVAEERPGQEPASTTPPKKVILFESGEHELIGDKVKLKFHGKDPISGSQFAYKAGAQGEYTLSYGLIVALAGDFYGNYTAGPGDAEQLSDNWDDDNPQKSVKLAFELAESLSADKEQYLGAVMSTMKKEWKEVIDGMRNGMDVAQIFHGFGEKYDKQFNIDTEKVPILGVGAYALLAHCNWDHFGQCAYNAYKAVHSAALDVARKAFTRPDKAEEILCAAYFLEAYAQHFLTDLFSSGHLRTPRRALHKTLFPSFATSDHSQFFDPVDWLSPRDRCAQKMHDEDCANGLWVTNAVGDTWAAYGDKQLLSGKSYQNFLQAVKACQAGVDEVFEASQNGKTRPPNMFYALQLTPILEVLNDANFSPMYKYDAPPPATQPRLFRRSNLDKRDDLVYLDRGYLLIDPQWTGELNAIRESGEDMNMYPFTQQFLVRDFFVHMRQPNPDNSPEVILLNIYGPLVSPDYGEEWSMIKQSRISLFAPADAKMTWIHAASLSPEVRSLIGIAQKDPDSPKKWYHIGVSTVQQVWNAEADTPGEEYTFMDASYGNYSSDPDSKVAMLRYWFKGQDAGLLDFWTVDTTFATAPTNAGTPLSDIYPLMLRLTHRIDDDTFDSFVGYGFQKNSSLTRWYFISWKAGYQTMDTTPLDESITLCPQALVSAKWGTSGSDCRIVRIFFGPESTGDTMQIDLLHFGRNPDGTIYRSPSYTSVPYDITWGMTDRADYLTWFFAKGNTPASDTLVALCFRESEGQTPARLVVVVFPAGQSSFKRPTISDITLDPARGTLLLADWMTPLRALRTSYVYPDEGKGTATTDAAIIMFFDNYGLLGTRVVAPVTKGSLEYELKGQTPAIAGQPSAALGMTNDTEVYPVALGILPKEGL
ncbi:hypothetical protein DFH07DRAFT_955203 [Mycena maculata]|uniref:Phospholipase C n=1 Tax=Mycena maculata TaxID=230809 RepID=A0AAD7NLV0_9AGAR|nr:hypothetical protein DFH07DRAFT_955203 [Mycena maculata]